MQRYRAISVHQGTVLVHWTIHEELAPGATRVSMPSFHTEAEARQEADRLNALAEQGAR